MTSADARSHWTEGELTDLHRTVLWALLRHVSPAPGAARPGAGRPVRGVLQPPGRPGLTRVVLGDGHDLGTSVAYDLPLVDAYDANVPWSAIEGTLRQLTAGPQPEPASRDGLGIPVVDAGAEAVRFGKDPAYDRSDALHAAVSVLSPFSAPPASGPGPELLLGGFLLIGPDTVRLYVDRTDGPAGAAGAAARIGLDVSLLDRGGRVRGGCTALMAALPSLVRGELDQNASEAEDPYCTAVYDFTYW